MPSSLPSSSTKASALTIVGFGSQAQAWARCYQQQGRNCRIALREASPRRAEAQAQNLEVVDLADLISILGPIQKPHQVALLCADTAIGEVYRKYLAKVEAPLLIILAHGYAIHAGHLKMSRPNHLAVLFAPKSIGPKITQNFLAAYPRTHALAAAILPQNTQPSEVQEFYREFPPTLGFRAERLIEASFTQETTGDLISEQGLLCGGLFNLLVYTVGAMQQRGVPDALIREECITELELIVALIQDRGIAQAFGAISQAAQYGTLLTGALLQRVGFPEGFGAQVEEIFSGRFSEGLESASWQRESAHFRTQLEVLERQLSPSIGHST